MAWVSTMPGDRETTQRTDRVAHRNDTLTAHVIATSVVLSIIFIVYFESYRSMASVWLSSDTFLHGLIIFPISMYLIRRKWPELRHIKPAPFFSGALVLLSLSLLWLMSDFLGIQVGKHFTIVAMVPAAVLTVMGLRFTQQIAFPLAYLVFAVPFGEVLIPILMDFTATFTVKALDLTGIPVTRDGRYFSIPSGNFEIARACSGIRYMLAALSLGTLYGYISFRSIGKRTVFFIFSMVLPVIANGFRAYGIVLLAHYSGMKIAIGVDHVIFGWIFFGAVITVMFLVGNHFHDAPLGSGAPETAEMAGFPAHTENSRRSMLLVLPLALICCVAGPMLGFMVSHSGQNFLSEYAKLPDNIPGWQASELYNQDFRPNFSGASRELYARYDNGGHQVNLAVIQYGGHSQNAELANYSNSVLAKSPFWQLGNVRNLSLDLQSGGAVNVQEVFAMRRGTTSIVWYWFNVNGQSVTSPLEIKLREAQNLLAGKRNISTAVILAVNGQDDIAVSRSVLRKFADASYGLINKCLSLSHKHPDCGRGIAVLKAN